MPRTPSISGTPPPSAAPPEGPRELIVIAHGEAGLRASGTEVAAASGADVAPLGRLLESAGVRMFPLFGASEERILREAAAAAETGVEIPAEMSLFYRVEAPDERLDDLAAALREQDVVEAAYVKPPTVPATLHDAAPAGEAPPATSPDFTARQGYLNAAPGGVDARHGWTRPGGGGAGVRIIDVEGAWRFTHEDLRLLQGGVVGGTVSADLGWRNHGTNVIGVFSGDRNTFGVTGICPDAVVSAVSIFPSGSAWAVRYAADRLGACDILLIELHRPGPRFNFQRRDDQRGYIAIEWWPDDYLAIKYATGRGILVVEAAGNGAENLSDVLYDANPPSPHGPFPSWWRNPYRRSPLDSGAILVGAGAPPPGTHGRDWGPDRSRLDFSNYGALVDAQGWGREVTTTGGFQNQPGDLQGGTNEDLWYTDRFSGTSSASPIVVGSLGCVQGALKARGLRPLTPEAARGLLRITGSPQQPATGRPVTQRIGNRPNIRQMAELVIPAIHSVPLYRYWNNGLGDHFYTTNWSELGSGRYGWGYERIQCFVRSAPGDGSVPLYRYWNGGIGDHFYTTSWSELGSGRNGWGYEGIQCYVFPVAVTSTGSVPVLEAEPAPEEVEAMAVAEVPAFGIPATFTIGEPEPAEAGVMAGAAPGRRQEPGPSGSGFVGSLQTPSWFEVKGGARPRNGGRSRPVTITFDAGGDDE